MSEKEWRKQFAEKFGLCIKLHEVELSIQEIAKYLGVHKTTVYRYLNGSLTPSGYTIHKLSKLFHMSPAYFIGSV